MTKKQALNIVLNCSKIYHNNLEGKNLAIISEDKNKNCLQIEISFYSHNFLHLTGLSIINKRIKSSVDFYNLCLKNNLSTTDFKFKSNRTTPKKLEILLSIMQIDKKIKMIGNYNNQRPYLITEKLIGNVNMCLGLVKEKEYYVPNSLLKEDIRDLVNEKQKILYIFKKNIKDAKYNQIVYTNSKITSKEIKKCVNLLKNMEKFDIITKNLEKGEINMDYKELADLIFPDAKEISYYEEKYPERNLPEGAMVVRVAPSPTGNVHIGTIYQAFLNRKLAKQTGGIFYVRVEDTDQKREIENGITQIIETLKRFDLTPDEGMINETESKGEYGPYRQSLRKEIYQAYAKHLLEQGKAYPCFATPEELDEMRAKQEAAKVRTGYYGVWAKYRNLSVEEAAEKIKAGEPYIVRFKSTGREDRKIKHKDVIKGNVEFPENDQDIIIIKSDGLPTYHFAHAIDDHLMHTTHVLRGDEWLSSVPLHLQLFQELGFKAPKYAHTPTLLKNDNGGKRKISKRKDPEAAASYYEEAGIPKDAVKEYLLNIANSSFENWRRANPDKSLDEFDFELNKMSVSGALFDMVKLLDVSKNVISKYSAEKVYEEVYKWAKEFNDKLAQLLEDKEYALKVFGIERENAKPRKDIAKWEDVMDNISYMYDSEFYKKDQEYEYQKVTEKELINKILKLYMEKYYNEADDKQTWFDRMKDLSEEIGFAREVKEFKANPEAYPGHVGDVSTVIRVALTSRSNTPDMYEIMQVLGKERIFKRFEKAIENLK